MKCSLILLLGAVCIHDINALFGIPDPLGIGSSPLNPLNYGKPWPRTAFKAKFADLLINGYYDLPQTTSSKLIKEYQIVPDETAQLDVPGDLYCRKNDARVCIIYDKKGNAIGVRTSFLVQDVKNVEGYDFEAVNTYKKTNVFSQPAYAFDVLFYDPATITAAGVGKRKEMADGIWAHIKGETVHLPLKDPKVENYKGFQKQACFPMMGQHYFYGMNKTLTDCTQHVPFFGLYHNGALVGYGLANYGKGSKAEGRNARNWYETVPLLGAQMIMPNRPKCVDENIKKNGLYSLHVYFVENPTLIQCLL